MRVEPERVALAIGLKPALRLRLSPPHRADVGGRYQDAGFAVLATDDHVYVARDLPAARHLARIDASLERLVLGRRYRALMRAMGEALGYPTCCVEAFVARARRRPERLLARLPAYRAEVYRTACAVWVARPRARLNPFLGGDEARLISFEPCRLDCPAANQWADRLAAAIAARDALGMAALDARLARDVVVCPRGSVGVVRLEGGRVAEAIPVPRAAGAPVTPPDAEAVLRAVGGEVDRRGRVGDGPGPRARALRFGG